MVYRGLGILAVVFGSSPTPLPLCPVKKLSLLLSLPVCRRSSLLMGEGGGGRMGGRGVDGEKALLSINHSILSGVKYGLF